MTIQEVKNNFVHDLAENAYINMCSVEEMNIAIKALEKQIPKKPYKTKEHKQNNWYCSICKCYLGDDMELQYACLQPKFCEHCGQRIDWSECNG